MFGSACAYFHPFGNTIKNQSKIPILEKKQKEGNDDNRKLKTIIEKLESELKNVKELLLNMEHKVNSQNETIQRLENTLKEKNKDIEETRKELYIKDEEIIEMTILGKKLEKKIQDKTEIVDNLNNRIKAKDMEVEDIKITYENHIKEITDSNSKLKKRVEGLEMFAKQQNIEAHKKNEELKEKMKIIALLKRLGKVEDSFAAKSDDGIKYHCFHCEFTANSKVSLSSHEEKCKKY